MRLIWIASMREREPCDRPSHSRPDDGEALGGIGEQQARDPATRRVR